MVSAQDGACQAYRPTLWTGTINRGHGRESFASRSWALRLRPNFGVWDVRSSSQTHTRAAQRRASIAMCGCRARNHASSGIESMMAVSAYTQKLQFSITATYTSFPERESERERERERKKQRERASERERTLRSPETRRTEKLRLSLLLKALSSLKSI